VRFEDRQQHLVAGALEGGRVERSCQFGNVYLPVGAVGVTSLADLGGGFRQPSMITSASAPAGRNLPGLAASREPTPEIVETRYSSDVLLWLRIPVGRRSFGRRRREPNKDCEDKPAEYRAGQEAGDEPAQTRHWHLIDDGPYPIIPPLVEELEMTKPALCVSAPRP
jgi:hypothetical protein